jgi:hypothetical protein
MIKFKRFVPKAAYIIIAICMLGLLISCNVYFGIEKGNIVKTAAITSKESTPVSVSKTFTPEPTQTITESPVPSLTSSAMNTMTPTVTPTPSIPLTPTFAFPEVVVNVAAAHCRYGPSKAYLHAADLYEGDHGVVQGRFRNSDWLYIKWDKINYRCWVSPYVVDITGDLSNIGYAEIGLERIPSTLYNPPQNVRAAREGDRVTITWDRVNMTADDDRGYLIEAWVCQNGSYIWWTVSFPDQFTTNYSVIDEAGCHSPSSGKIFTVEKHGYTQPTVISWPQP